MGCGHWRRRCSLLQNFQPDLILSDLMMPELDGMGLLKALKEEARTSHIPVVMLTARTGMETRLKALRIGVHDYLTKPFDETSLQFAIELAISKIELDKAPKPRKTPSLKRLLLVLSEI